MNRSKVYDVIIVDALGLFHRNNGDTHNNVSVKVKRMCGSEVVETEERTSGIFGFIKTLAYMRNHFDFVNLVICWDGGNHRRREMFPAYKANRHKDESLMSEEEILESKIFRENMNWQIEHLQNLLKYFGICQIRTNKEEADDVIAAFCHKNSEAKIGVFSNDKDLQQLINDNVDIVKVVRKKSASGGWYKEEKIVGVEEYKEENNGLHPKEHWQILALTGDGADNIPGIKGCGDVTAKNIINKYGHIRKFNELKEEELEKIPRCPVKKQMEFKKILSDLIDINEKLVKLYPDVKTVLRSTDEDYDLEKATELCQYLQFNSLFNNDNKLFEALENLRLRP